MTSENLDLGTDHVLCDITGPIATVTLNRPEKRNAFGPEMLTGLTRALDLTSMNDTVRVVVLTGSGTVFCAGGDMAGMGGNGADAPMDEKVRALTEMQEAATLTLFHHPKPVIAVLPGVAAGAGMSLALACDLRIAVEGAGFVPAFGAIAASGDFGGSWLLPKLIGPARAKEIYFTGRRVDTAEAAALGLFNRVVSTEALNATVQATATHIAAQAPIALRNMKANHNLAMATDLKTTMEQEAKNMMQCLHTQDHIDAVQAFFAKEKPVFHGR
ncbi:MAG: enoyl-CoA hydratase-related protein [Aliishimia sp.]